MRLLKRKSERTEKKTALWALSSSSTEEGAALVRAESLLTEEDKAAPVCVLPTGDKGTRRKVSLSRLAVVGRSASQPSRLRSSLFLRLKLTLPSSLLTFDPF